MTKQTPGRRPFGHRRLLLCTLACVVLCSPVTQAQNVTQTQALTQPEAPTVLQQPSVLSQPINAQPINSQPMLALPAIAGDRRQILATDAAALRREFDTLLNDQWTQLESKRSDSVRILMQKSQRIFELNQATRSIVKTLWERRLWATDEELPAEQHRAMAKSYLEMISAWIEFSGRLRYATSEQVRQVAPRLPRSEVTRLIDMAQQDSVGIVGSALAYILVEPPPGSKVIAFDDATRLKLLYLIKSTHQIDATPALYELLKWPHTPDHLWLHMVDALRSIGISQVPEQKNKRATPSDLLAHIREIDEQSLSYQDRDLKSELTDWLAELSDKGLTGDSFRWGPVEIQPGDWILQRNPSPYNRFTDLSPGLFTHVGIAAEINDGDRRQIMIVDLPETGTKICAATADEFVSSSLHWLVLRHRDPEAAKKMGRIASDLVGRTAEFDLTFNIDLIEKQTDIVKTGVPVHTYCAGFLALCAQEAGLNRDDLFPFIEHPINERCAENLKSLGLTMSQFVSPTGPFFSQQFTVVGSRQPMYSPTNEIREAVYDHFAMEFAKQPFELRQSTAQQLRQELAQMSSQYTWVRNALAKASNVNPSMDLIVAARVATIVENLDAIADRQAEKFEEDMKKTSKPTQRVIQLDLTRRSIEAGKAEVNEMFFDPSSDPSSHSVDVR